MCHLCVRSLDEMNSLNRYRPEHLALVKEYLDKGPKGQAVFFLHHTVIEYAEQEVRGAPGS